MSRFGWYTDDPVEPHITASRADLTSHTRNTDFWMAGAYTAAEIAYLIDHGLVCEGWPLEFTPRGKRWYRAGGITPPVRNIKAWRQADEEAFDDRGVHDRVPDG